MNIPQIQNLHSQSFNSEFIEFVWRFSYESFKHINHQLICKFNKDGSIFIEGGMIDVNGEYHNTDGSKKFSYSINDIDELTCQNLSHTVDIFFNNGEDLVSLQKEIIEYLK